MKLWGSLFVVIMAVGFVALYNSMDVFAGATEAKVKLEADRIRNNFRSSVSDGSTPKDTVGWVTNVNLRDWKFMDRQIVLTLPRHPLSPYEQYHYKIWTDKSGKKNLAVWARFKKKGTTIYCNNRLTSELTADNLADDNQAGLLCEKN